MYIHRIYINNDARSYLAMIIFIILQSKYTELSDTDDKKLTLSSLI